jgi:hypothetical protein
MKFPVLIKLNDTLNVKAFVPNLAQKGYAWLYLLQAMFQSQF